MNRTLISIFLLFFLIGCGGSNSDSSCTECGGGLLDGYLYKEVIFGDDFTSLGNIDVYPNIGDCIRYKTDEDEFSEVEVVDYCCCIEFQ